VATSSAVATLVRRKPGVTVGADEAQVVATVVGGVAVHVVQDECEGLALPPTGLPVDRAVTLLLGDVAADVVIGL
jgi:hypothetical protein